VGAGKDGQVACPLRREETVTVSPGDLFRNGRRKLPQPFPEAVEVLRHPFPLRIDPGVRAHEEAVRMLEEKTAPGGNEDPSRRNVGAHGELHPEVRLGIQQLLYRLRRGVHPRVGPEDADPFRHAREIPDGLLVAMAVEENPVSGSKFHESPGHGVVHLFPAQMELSDSPVDPPPEARWERDIAFRRIPGSSRELLCDLWQPPEGTPSSHLAFLYFHGSGWHWLDKDFNTRRLFRHLCAQGHVVMDVAYRLCPEVDAYGMLGDVKRAIAWMKENAEKYDVDPRRVVTGGGSAGGHLALLAAYAPDHPELTPDDVKDADLSVSAVVSYYGPVDMRAYYDHAGATLGKAVGGKKK